VYKLVHPIIAARKQSRRTTTYGGSTGIRSYVDSLLDLQIPDISENNGDTTTTGTKRRPLTDKEMVKLVFEFLGTNTESVVSCVEWTLAHLVIDPEVQKKLHREITGIQQDYNGIVVSEERLHRLPYLRAVMLESLRLHPPVPIMARDVSAKDAAIAGTPAAPDDAMPAVVITDIHKIGRNSKVWTDPDEFRQERFLAGGEAEGVSPVPGPKEIRMVPFGAGRRYCPGVDLGMIRVGCILTALVRDFHWALPADGNSLDLNEFRAFFLMMKTPLRARITPCALAATATATMCDPPARST
jgi:cytochrome P450